MYWNTLQYIVIYSHNQFNVLCFNRMRTASSLAFSCLFPPNTRAGLSFSHKSGFESVKSEGVPHILVVAEKYIVASLVCFDPYGDD